MDIEVVGVDLYCAGCVVNIDIREGTASLENALQVWLESGL